MGSIFQLGAAEAMQVAGGSPFLAWAELTTGLMESAGLEDERIQQFRVEADNLEEAAKGDGQQAVHQAEGKLARLLAGIKNDQTENFALPERSKAWVFVARSQYYIQFPESLNQRIHRAILNATPEAIKAFVHFWERETRGNSSFTLDEEQMTALTYLLEEGEQDADAIWLLMLMEDPLQTSRLYRTYLERYTRNPTLRLVPDSSLSQGERLAIYLATRSIQQDIVMHGRNIASIKGFPDFNESFEKCLEVECALAELSKAPISLESFARRLLQHSFVTDKDEPYCILSFLLEPNHFAADEILRVSEIIFQKEDDVRKAFQKNLDVWPSVAGRNAAVELLEMNLPFDGDLFQKYLSTPNRKEKIRETEERARELAAGGEMGDWDDPFELIAIHRALGGKVGWLALQEVLGKSKIPNRSAGAYCRPFAFSVPLVKPFYDVANKGTLEKYAREIDEISTFEGLIKVIKNFNESKAARRHINSWLQGVDDISSKIKSDKSYLSSKGARIEMQGVLQGILHTLKKWIAERAEEFIKEELVKTGKKKNRDTAIVKANHEIDRYVVRLLTGLAYWWVEAYQPSFLELFFFNKRRATEEDTYEALDTLSEFYVEYLPDVEKEIFDELFPSLPSLDAIQRQLKKMNERKKERTGESVDVALFPGTGKLDSFYGYMSDNCLRKPDWALHGMKYPDFVPYRMIVDRKWRGVVQTFTKNVTVEGEKKKILIVTGVDPQINFTPDPKEFLNGLEKGFWEIAREGGYDLVVVPAAEFAQSSRRALLRGEFKRYKEKVLIDEPVGFPQVGVRPDGSPKYYNNVQHQEFLVFRST